MIVYFFFNITDKGNITGVSGGVINIAAVVIALALAIICIICGIVVFRFKHKKLLCRRMEMSEEASHAAELLPLRICEC